MRSSSGTLFLAIALAGWLGGVILLVTALRLDVTLTTTFGTEVVNAGKLQDQLMLLIGGCAALVVATVASAACIIIERLARIAVSLGAP